MLFEDDVWSRWMPHASLLPTPHNPVRRKGRIISERERDDTIIETDYFRLNNAYNNAEDDIFVLNVMNV